MDEHSSITIDDETAYRERATVLLDGFAEQARGVLRDAGIGIDLIFVVPRKWRRHPHIWYGRRDVQRGMESHQSDRFIARAALRSGWIRPSAGMSCVRWHTQVNLLLDRECPSGLEASTALRLSRLIDIDRAMLTTVPGATPNLLAVGLIPMPAATHAQI